jgi:hypothetical protein
VAEMELERLAHALLRAAREAAYVQSLPPGLGEAGIRAAPRSREERTAVSIVASSTSW